MSDQGNSPSPQFKEEESPKIESRESYKLSNISGLDLQTPETKYRSTMTPMKLELSKVSGTSHLHMRQKTAKF